MTILRCRVKDERGLSCWVAVGLAEVEAAKLSDWDYDLAIPQPSSPRSDSR